LAGNNNIENIENAFLKFLVIMVEKLTLCNDKIQA